METPGRWIAFLTLCFGFLPADAARAADAPDGLQALYDFKSSSGAIVKDRSGAGEPVDLEISNPKAVRRAEGLLEVRGETLIQSAKPASRIVDAVRRTGEITIEAWIRPAGTDLKGPARIVTLSRDSNERNFTLGQDGNKFDVRFRTTATSTNGIPSLASKNKSLTAKLTHVVYTRDRGGRTRVYLDGKPSEEGTVKGATSNWAGSYKLALANELNESRPWQGTYHLVAIYNRDLSPKEVRQRFEAGVDKRPVLARAGPDPKEKLFETQIAPLLAERCLECHDSSAKKGKLDLSRKTAAFAGGKKGDAIVPGDSGKSLVWEAIASGEMPDERDPLSDEEKKLVREWIDSGAVWTTEVIDAATYSRNRRAREIWLQRLTLPEYIETVRSAAGVDIAAEAREILPPDLRADGFSNTAYNLNIDLSHVGAYAKLAGVIVERMDVLKFAGRFSEKQKLNDDDMRDLISKMGKWLLRRPLEGHEVDSFRGITTTVASAGGGFEEAVSYVIEAMLQSPGFLYRIENQRGDGTLWPVGEYELASRLSYILWGGPPDRELMRAADSGDLVAPDAVEAQVRRMLEDPRTVARSARFIAEWLDLDRLENLRPAPEKFPGWDERLSADMREETLAFFEDVVWNQKRPLADLLNAQVTYVTPRLAKHYGLEPGAGEKVAGDDSGLLRIDVSSAPGRGGLLTQGSVLTAGGDEASMVTRGLFVLHNLLRGAVEDPPPCIDTTPPPTMAGLTQRGIAERRIADRNCGGCHAKFEPLAFGLEKFDGVGAYHEKDEHGNRLRDDGEILFPGAAEPVSYRTSAELMDLLAASDRVRECLAWKLAQFALGRPLDANDAMTMRQIHKKAQEGGGTYASLITAIVMSDLVQTTRTEGEENDE